MNFSKYLLISIFGLFFSFSSAKGEETNTIEFEKQIITASKDDALSSINTVFLNNSDYHFESLNSILAYQPGLQSQSAGAAGSFSSLWMRGSSAKAVDVYLDGIRINDPLNGSINLSTIPIWALGSIQIDKNNSMSSVANTPSIGNIQLLSKEYLEQADLKASFGSFSQSNISGAYGDRNLLIIADAFTSDNNFPYIHNNQTDLYSGDDFETNRKNNQAKRNSGIIKHKIALGSAYLQNAFIYRSYKAGISNTYNDAETAFIKQDSGTLSTNYSQKNFNFSINYTDSNHLYDDLKDEIGLSSDQQILNYKNWEASGRYNSNLSNNISSTLNIRFESINIDGSRIEDNDKFNFSEEGAHSTLSQSFNISDFNIHYSYGRRTIKDVNSDYFNFGINFLTLSNSNFKNVLTASKKSRLPTISELYINQGNQVGNSDLKEEKYYELSNKLDYKSSIFGTSVEAFYRLSENTIIVSYDARGIGRASNTGKSLITGFEALIYSYLNTGTELQFTTTVMHSEDQTSDRPTEGKYLPSFHHLTHSTSISQWINRLKLEIELQGKLGLYYDSINTHKAPDQFLVNFSSEWEFSKGSIGFKANNLLDKEYTGFKTEPLPGINYLISMQLKL